MGFGLIIGFIEHLKQLITASKDYAFTVLHPLLFTRAQT
jgi:hypothetical protein